MKKVTLKQVYEIHQQYITYEILHVKISKVGYLQNNNNKSTCKRWGPYIWFYGVVIYCLHG